MLIDVMDRKYHFIHLSILLSAQQKLPAQPECCVSSQLD